MRGACGYGGSCAPAEEALEIRLAGQGLLEFVAAPHEVSDLLSNPGLFGRRRQRELDRADFADTQVVEAARSHSEAPHRRHAGGRVQEEQEVVLHVVKDRTAANQVVLVDAVLDFTVP